MMIPDQIQPLRVIQFGNFRRDEILSILRNFTFKDCNIIIINIELMSSEDYLTLLSPYSVHRVTSDDRTHLESFMDSC